MDVLNPYDSPRGVVDAPGGECRSYARWRFWVWLGFYGYPVWAAVGLYQSWVVAWLVLGRCPRPMLDDPKYIGALMDVSYLLSYFAILGAPLLLQIGLVASFFCPVVVESRKSKGIVLAMVYVMVCIALWMVVRADPGGVVYWWMD